VRCSQKAGLQTATALFVTGAGISSLCVVLGIGPGRARPVQAHRASCQTGSGQQSPKDFWAVPCQPEV
jgi:hypothetical protein